MTAEHPLPQRIPLRVRNPGIPYRRTTLARAALLIRVAEGLDDWCARDTRAQHRTPQRGNK